MLKGITTLGFFFVRVIDLQTDLTAIPWDSAFVYDDIDDVWNHWSKLYKDSS